MTPWARLLPILLALAGASFSRAASGQPCANAREHAGVASARLGQVTFEGSPVTALESSEIVRIVRQGQTVRPKPCMQLFMGDLVETGPATTATVELGASVALVRPSSRIRLESSGPRRSSIWAFFGEIFGFGRLTVQDRYVTAGAEGTAFRVRSEAGTTLVEVYEGHVRVDPRKEGLPTRLLARGQAVTLGEAVVTGMSEFLVSRSALELEHYLAEQGASTGLPRQTLQALDDWAASAQNSNRISLLVEGKKPIALPKAGSLSVVGAWSHLWLRPSWLFSGAALGSRLLLSGGFGQYRSPMTDPASGREEKAREGTALLPFNTALAGADMELHVLPEAPLGYSVGLGMRAGWSHQRYVASEADALVWGPALSGRGYFRQAGGYSFLLELSLVVQRTPVAACPIGCRELAQPRPSIWDGWLGLALGLEMEL